MKVDRKTFFKLLVLCLLPIFMFGGCSVSSDDDVDIVKRGKYLVLDGEDFDNPDWMISHESSYIRVFSFKRIDGEYEITFSGILFWKDNYGNSHYQNIPVKTISMVRIDDYLYETKFRSDPYVGIEVFDDENFDLYTDDFLVNLYLE